MMFNFFRVIIHVKQLFVIFVIFTTQAMNHHWTIVYALLKRLR
jgi:hypothetical protein